MTDQLIYEKFGTRIAAGDERDQRLQAFVFDGTLAMAEAAGWQLLPGQFERVPVGTWDDEEIFAYLWPVTRPTL